MAENNTVPNLEVWASDGNSILTPRHKLEIFRQFTKPEHKFDVAPLLKAFFTESGWTEEEAIDQEDFIWGVGPEALYQLTITKQSTKFSPDYETIFFKKNTNTKKRKNSVQNRKQGFSETHRADFAMHQTSPIHKCPASESNCNNCGKKGLHARACEQRSNNNRTVRKLTEEELKDPNESMSESDESIRQIEEFKNVEEKQNLCTTIIEVNAVQYELIIDRGALVTIMPLDERIVAQFGKTEDNKPVPRYQQNRRENRGKNKEYENNKTEIPITERTVMTTILGAE